jgi:hypothetical protein
VLSQRSLIVSVLTTVVLVTATIRQVTVFQAPKLLYHVLSGHAYFSGVAFIQIAWLIALYSGGRWPAVVRAVAACVGLILVAVSATPLPTWFYLIAGPATLVWIWLESSTRTTARRSRRWFRCAVPAMWGLGIVLELPIHLVPALQIWRGPTSAGHASRSASQPQASAHGHIDGRGSHARRGSPFQSRSGTDGRGDLEPHRSYFFASVMSHDREPK